MELTEQEKKHYAGTLETVEKALLDGTLKSLTLSANFGEDSTNPLLGDAMDISISFSHILRQHMKAIKFVYATAITLNELSKDGNI